MVDKVFWIFLVCFYTTVRVCGCQGVAIQLLCGSKCFLAFYYRVVRVLWLVVRVLLYS